MCELLFPLLRRGGRVVNVSSGAGYPGFLRTGLPGLVPPGHPAHAEQIIAAVTAPDLSLAALEDMVRGYQQLADAGPDKVVSRLPKILVRLKNTIAMYLRGRGARTGGCETRTAPPSSSSAR